MKVWEEESPPIAPAQCLGDSAPELTVSPDRSPRASDRAQRVSPKSVLGIPNRARSQAHFSPLVSMGASQIPPHVQYVSFKGEIGGASQPTLHESGRL